MHRKICSWTKAQQGPSAKINSMTKIFSRLVTTSSIILMVAGSSLHGHTASAAAASGTPESSLYTRLGGDKTVARIVDETLTAVGIDPRTRRTFEKVDVKRLKAKIVEHICALADGGCKYTGDTMKQSHAGLEISEAEFYLMVNELRNALDRHVGEREKNELLKILAPMKRDIVTG